MIAIRAAIRSVLRFTGLSRRTPETMSTPLPSNGEISVHVDDDAFTLEDDIAPVLAPTLPDPGAVLPASTLQIPRPVCLDPTPGSMQWWRTHAWIRFDCEFICGRCDRVWPEQQDPADE
jgi:hypothetical protein